MSNMIWVFGQARLFAFQGFFEVGGGDRSKREKILILKGAVA